MHELKAKTHSQVPSSDLLKLAVAEMQHAETVIIRAAQASSFGTELASCNSADTQVTVRKDSALWKLDTFLNKDGILCVGGRIRRARLPDSSKFPAILHKTSHVSTLVVRHYHEKVHHQGQSITHNEMRSNGFCVVGGSALISSLVSRCVTFHKLRGSTFEPKMADLPEDRLEPTTPFTNYAVDYFGPFQVKQGRKDVKRYGVLFTCMASRAIHLVVSTTLETDSFLNALHRFLCCRGLICQICCDQGNNLVGVKNELMKCVLELDHDKISSELLKANCD